MRCDECTDARDAGPLGVLLALGWHVRTNENPEDLCPQCNPAHAVGSALGRRDTERENERAVAPLNAHTHTSPGSREPAGP